MKRFKLIENWKLTISASEKGFASILPLIIIAISLISTTASLLVENILKGNPPLSRITSDEAQRIASDCNIVTGNNFTLNNDCVLTENLVFDTADVIFNGNNHTISNPEGGNFNIEIKKNNITIKNVVLSELGKGEANDKKGSINIAHSVKNTAITNVTINNPKGRGINFATSSSGKVLDSKVNNSKLTGIYFGEDATGEIRENTLENNVFGIVSYGKDIKITGNKVNNSTDIGIYFSENATGEIRENTLENSITGILLTGNSIATISDNTISGGKSTKNASGIVLKESAGIENIGNFPANNKFSNNATGNCQSLSPNMVFVENKPDIKCPNNDETKQEQSRQPQQPTVQDGPISGIVNVVGSVAKSVNVNIKNENYNKDFTANKDAGIAWKFSSGSLSAGKYTVTATAKLENGNTLSKSIDSQSNTLNLQIDIFSYSGNIISEKCVDKGGIKETTPPGGFSHTACLSEKPNTLEKAKEGKFDADKAAVLKDKGNVYCGKQAFDVYQCKDGSIATIDLGNDICNNLPWCPKTADEAFKPDPCAEPEKGETCACTPENTATISKGNCKANLFCAPGKNPQIPGYACCPEGKQFCPSQNACVQRFEDCVQGKASPTPLPTQFQFLGCPNENPDGTKNVCSSESDPNKQPTDGLRGGASGYDRTKNYIRLPNGDPACAGYYSNTNPARAYCWKESGSSSQTGGGGTGGSPDGGQSGGGTAGVDGKACSTHEECAIGFSGQGDRACYQSYVDSTGRLGAKACCDFTQRWCTVNNKCVGSPAECVTPTPKQEQGVVYSCITENGRCFLDQQGPGGTSRCCTKTDFPHNPNYPDLSCKQVGTSATYSCQKSANTGSTETIITPHPGGCPNPNGKSKCVAAQETCPNGTYDSKDLSRAKACSIAVPGTGKCCVENGVSLSSVQIASDNSCKTSKDCLNSKTGNACVHFGSSFTGICKNY